MTPKLLLVASMTVVVMATAGGCDALPGGTPTQVPTVLPDGVPTQLPDGVPTQLPDGVPTQLPDGIPTQLPAVPAVPGLPGGEAAPTDGVAAPLPSAAPSPVASEPTGIVDDAADAVGGVPWWVWTLLVLLLLGLLAAIVALRRAKAAELEWAALWHELTGEARWLDERVVPAVQDRSLDPGTLSTRWQDGSRRFDDLDRRVWAAAEGEQRPPRRADLTGLSDGVLRLRDAVDAEVALRTSGYEEPGLYDAALAVADARDDLRRTVTDRTR
ncbi:hypothetical protein [Aquipuribacter hungaricus]|uniref:Uncharacterized protein n=1 Tax=Aquipuribacter hungaricus TaxID=545624 RepID=A0ABV7WDR4_9MICO